MTNVTRFVMAASTLIVTSGAWVGLSAQPQPQSLSPAAPATGVLVLLTVKPDTPRPEVMKVLPAEVRDTMRLYLDGKISQWYGRSDGRGVVFIMNCETVDEAKAITDTLPLTKADLVTFEYVALTPLTPLRLLLTEPASAPKE